MPSTYAAAAALLAGALTLAAPLGACGQRALRADSTVIAIQATLTRVAVGTWEGRGEGRGVVLLNVHDDENTAVEAGRAVLARRGGRLVELRHTGARTLALRRPPPDTARSAVDPNRMFTDAGAERSLRALGRFDPAVLRGVRAFADTLLARAGLDTARVVVALHNNTEANYSVRSYMRGGEYAADAALVFRNPRMDDDDFFYVTDRAVFDALRRRAFNVVLQDNRRVTDDGSLSVLAALRGQRYVNVEAQHGHLAQQTRMLTALLDVLRDLPAPAAR